MGEGQGWEAEAEAEAEGRLETERVTRPQPDRLDLGLGEEGLPQRDHVVRTARARRHTWHAGSTVVAQVSSGNSGLGEQLTVALESRSLVCMCSSPISKPSSPV